MARYLVAFDPGNPIPTRIKYIDDATVPPTVTDDAVTIGVSVGSIWVDTTGPDIYMCVDASTGAAVWVLLGMGS